MSRRLELRLADIEQMIANIRALFAQRGREQIASDPIARAAYERFLEIISEASRHIPQHMKDRYAHIPWREIAAIGNILRHVYHVADADVLLNIYEHDLDPLQHAIEAMKADLAAGR